MKTVVSSSNCSVRVPMNFMRAKAYPATGQRISCEITATVVTIREFLNQVGKSDSCSTVR